MSFIKSKETTIQSFFFYSLPRERFKATTCCRDLLEEDVSENLQRRKTKSESILEIYKGWFVAIKRGVICKKLKRTLLTIRIRVT